MNLKGFGALCGLRAAYAEKQDARSRVLHLLAQAQSLGSSRMRSAAKTSRDARDAFDEAKSRKERMQDVPEATQQISGRETIQHPHPGSGAGNLNRDSSARREHNTASHNQPNFRKLIASLGGMQ